MSHLAPKKQGPHTAHPWHTVWDLINHSLLF